MTEQIADIKPRQLIWITVCFFIAQIGLVYLNFTPYKFPNDGSNYVTMAQGLLSSGTLEDRAVIPTSLVWGYQNGIAYIIAMIKACFGHFWPVAYTLLISGLWSVAVIEVYKLIYSWFLDQKIAVTLAILSYFQYDVIITSVSFYNEAVYIPLLLINLTFLLSHIAKKKDDSRETPFQLWKVLTFIGFFIFGVFFRYQHITFVAALNLYVLFCSRKWLRHIFCLDVVLVVLFWFYVSHTTVAKADGFFWETIKSFPSRVSVCNAINMIQQFVCYIYPSRLFGDCSIWALCTGLLAIPVVVAGFFKLRMNIGRKAYFIAFFILTNLGFAFVTPCWGDRYSLPVNFVVLLLAAVGAHKLLLPKKIIESVLLAFVVLTSLLSMRVLYTYIGGINSGSYSVYPLLRVHYNFKSQYNPDEYLVYAQDPSLTHWALDVRVCNVAPEKCTQLLDKSKNSGVVYFGSLKFLEENPNLSGYKVVGNKVTQLREYGAWLLTKAK